MNIQLMNAGALNLLGENADVKMEGEAENQSLFSQLMDSEITGDGETSESESKEPNEALVNLSGMIMPQPILTRLPEYEEAAGEGVLDLEKLNTEINIEVTETQLPKAEGENTLPSISKSPNAPIVSELDNHVFSTPSADVQNKELMNIETLNMTTPTLEEVPQIEASLINQSLNESATVFNKDKLKPNTSLSLNQEELKQQGENDKLASSVLKDLTPLKTDKLEIQTLSVVNHREILDKTLEVTDSLEESLNGEMSAEFNQMFSQKKDELVAVDYKSQSVMLNGITRSDYTQPKVVETTSLSTQNVVWENQSEFEELMIKQSSMMKDGDKTTMVINLKPYTLGEMRISLEMRDGKLKALIQLEEAESKKVVEESLKMLQGDLKTSIIEVEQMYSSSKDGKNYDENQSRQQRHHEDNNRHKQDGNEFEKLMDDLRHSGVEILV